MHPNLLAHRHGQTAPEKYLNEGFARLSHPYFQVVSPHAFICAVKIPLGAPGITIACALVWAYVT